MQLFANRRVLQVRITQSELPVLFLNHTKSETMKQGFTLCAVLLFCHLGWSQDNIVKGKLLAEESSPLSYANIVLYQLADSVISKVEVSDDQGQFAFHSVPDGSYYLEASFMGYEDLVINDIELSDGQEKDLGNQRLSTESLDLETAVVSAQRSLVEIKPDRMVFNVQGTINSSGENAIELLRKAPGVLVDNNNNISVLSRSGVLVYVDGKRLPLGGEDLSNYLQNLTAEQIDRIDIITNPGAKYEAEGNAGIIDIRLKKDENFGANGSVSGNYSQGTYARGNLNASGNYRNQSFNVFGNAGMYDQTGFFNMKFNSLQNGLNLIQNFRNKNIADGINFRLGTDWFVGKNHTIGFLVSNRNYNGINRSTDRISIAPSSAALQIDSLLSASNFGENNRDQNTYNINYTFNKDHQTLNVDLDYGRFRNTSERFQPNEYYDASGTTLLSSRTNTFDTPQDIDIYTAKIDYETKLGDLKLGMGGKLSKVSTDNTFLFYDLVDQIELLNNYRSNHFVYDESVYAGYLSLNGQLTDKLSFTTGLRAEQTDATGDLQAFLEELQEPPVEFKYLQWFPSAGLTYQVTAKHVLALNYSRRINRPDYNVLNPFNNKQSELSFEKGNPFLQPEIVNNIELGYTLAYRYNFKLAYSYTTDQITRLIAPSEEDPRASFITWENLATQKVYSANVSAPVQMTKWWNAYMNLNGSYINNQADYGGEATVDVQVWNYNIYQQHTFDLFKGLKGEVSGWFAGPGVWGGVFRYDVQWSLNLGLQKKFLDEKLNIKLSLQDIFYESGWSGVSEFNGLISAGAGRWDSRRVALSASYNFGNQKVKSRKRKSGLEEERNRVEQE